jgi:hypothetical protein
MDSMLFTDFLLLTANTSKAALVPRLDRFGGHASSSDFSAGAFDPIPMTGSNPQREAQARKPNGVRGRKKGLEVTPSLFAGRDRKITTNPTRYGKTWEDETMLHNGLLPTLLAV